MTEVHAPRRRRSWGRRLLITLIVLLVILIGALVVADRLGRGYAQDMISDKVAEQVRSQGATSDTPEVSIEGFPFLTQVLAGRYEEIAIKLPNFSGPSPQNDGKKVHLSLLDVSAKDVSAPISTLRSGGSVVLGSVSGTGTIDYKQLVSLVGQPGLTLTEKDGKLTGSAKVSALQQTFTVNGAAELTVTSKGAVQVKFADVDSPDLPNIPAIKNIVKSYANTLSFTVAVPTLPLKLKLQKVEAEADGLHFTAGATNVALNSSGV